MRHFIAVNLIILFSAFTISAQVNDFMMWQKLTIEKSLNKINGFTISEGLRLNENATVPYKFLLEAEWNHRFSKTLKTALVYRFMANNPVDNLETAHRFYADISLRKKIGHWQLGWRIRMQSSYYATANETGFDYETVNRHKLSLQYKQKKLPVTPFAEYECFVPVDLFPDVFVNENRYSIGIAYKINKRQRVTIRYRLFQPLTKKVPEYDYVLGVKWSLKI